jgi:hypothetical protein
MPYEQSGAIHTDDGLDSQAWFVAVLSDVIIISEVEAASSDTDIVLKKEVRTISVWRTIEASSLYYCRGANTK